MHTPDEALPADFGKYRLEKRIAAGGMAEVFLAHRLDAPHEPLVIKRILPHISQDKSFVQMFTDEARMAANLDHPNVVRILDLGLVEGTYFMAMEYVHGEDIRRIYNRAYKLQRSLPLSHSVRIIADAALGLAYAHKLQDPLTDEPMGLVHRDVSPQNIIVTYAGDAKVVDFGIAKAAHKVQQTRAGQLKGKYSYMSPEQAVGDPLDHRTDIFALGVILYETTTGTRLFKRHNELATLQAVMKCEVPPPRQALPNYPPQLEAILVRALAKRPERRWQNGAALSAALYDFLDDAELRVEREQVGAFMRDLFADDDPAPSPSAPAPSRASEGRGSGLEITAAARGRPRAPPPTAGMASRDHDPASPEPAGFAASVADLELGEEPTRSETAPSASEPRPEDAADERRRSTVVVRQRQRTAIDPSPAGDHLDPEAASSAADRSLAASLDGADDHPSAIGGPTDSPATGRADAPATAMADDMPTVAAVPVFRAPRAAATVDVGPLDPADRGPTQPSAPPPAGPGARLVPAYRSKRPPRPGIGDRTSRIDARRRSTPPRGRPDGPGAWIGAAPRAIGGAVVAAVALALVVVAGAVLLRWTTAPGPVSASDLAQLTVATESGAMVTLAGRMLGVAGLDGRAGPFEVPAGAHPIRVHHANSGFERERTLILEAGQNYFFEIRGRTGWLRLVVTPWAEVTIDGKSMGRTPLPRIGLLEGVHQVQLENPAFERIYDAPVRIEAGREALVRVDLADRVR